MHDLPPEYNLGLFSDHFLWGGGGKMLDTPISPFEYFFIVAMSGEASGKSTIPQSKMM